MWLITRKQIAILVITLGLYVIGKMYRTEIPVPYVRDSFPSILFAPALYYATLLALSILNIVTLKRYQADLFFLYAFLSIFIPEVVMPLLSAKYTADVGDIAGTLIGWMTVALVEKKNVVHMYYPVPSEISVFSAPRVTEPANKKMINSGEINDD